MQRPGRVEQLLEHIGVVSVIIPTWNEEANLEETVRRISPGASEVIVVDSGSEDGTVRVAQSLGAAVVDSPVRMRAAQLNLGAARARGEILLFLHADTHLHRAGIERIEKALSFPGVVGGAFARRFASRSMFLRFTCLAAELRNRVFGWHLGDQAMFVRRTVFQELGGFREMAPFEDLDFSRRLARRGKVVTLRPPVISSARRFEQEGPLIRTLRDVLLTVEHIRKERGNY